MADIITIVMLISVIASVYGVFFLPILALPKLAGNGGGILSYLIFIASIMIVLVLTAGLFSQLIVKLSLPSGRYRQRSFTGLMKGLLILLLAGMAAVLAISTGYGFLAVFIHYIFKELLDLAKIKTIINIVTNIITVLVLPFFVLAVFNFLAGMKPARSIAKAFKNIKAVYFKLLLPVIFIYVMGVILSWPMGLLPSDVLGKIIRTILLSAAGTGSLLLMLAGFPAITEGLETE